MNWVKVNSPKFTDHGPDDLVEYVRNGNSSAMDEILDLKKDYLLTLNSRVSHKRNADKTIKSFFSHNRVTIPRDTTLRLRGDKPKVRGDLNPEHIRDVIHSSNLVYKAIFSTMIMSGMGQDELVYWSNMGLEALERDLNDEKVEVIKVNLVGRKGEKFDYNYFTYLGPEAVELLRRYLASRPKRVAFAVKRTGKTPKSIFLNQYGKALTKNALYRYWTRKLVRLGLIQPEKIEGDVKRYGRNPHEVRDVFRTLWRRSSSDVVYAEYFMGHSDAFDKHGYDKTYEDEGLCLQEYMKAVPYLSILSGTKPYRLVDENEVEKLRAENKELRKEIEKRIDDELEYRDKTDKRLDELYRMIKEKQ
jgi:integrase